MQGRTCGRVKVYIHSVDFLSSIVSVELLTSHLFTKYMVYFHTEIKQNYKNILIPGTIFSQ